LKEKDEKEAQLSLQDMKRLPFMDKLAKLHKMAGTYCSGFPFKMWTSNM
jgi:hypothetical protein